MCWYLLTITYQMLYFQNTPLYKQRVYVFNLIFGIINEQLSLQVTLYPYIF